MDLSIWEVFPIVLIAGINMLIPLATVILVALIYIKLLAIEKRLQRLEALCFDDFEEEEEQE